MKRKISCTLRHTFSSTCNFLLCSGIERTFLQKCQKISKGINFPKNYEFGHQPSKYSLLVSEEEMTVV
jgi:hypothetical protein